MKIIYIMENNWFVVFYKENKVINVIRMFIVIMIGLWRGKCLFWN